MARFYLILGESLFVATLCVVAVLMFRQPPSPIPGAVPTKLRLVDASAQVYLQQQADGTLQYFVCRPGAAPQKAGFEELTTQIYQAGREGHLASTLRDLGAYSGASSTTVWFWLLVGFFGQLLFTGRMLVQWIASERKGTSIVPPMFWWMSLVGSLVLVAYFLWRRDPNGLLGQAFGSFVYLRNIIWILEGKRLGPIPATQAADPMPES
jgi:lipid-A-disaccharide synthase-like uncharacterized protein